jgi:NADH dehydrogenase
MPYGRAKVVIVGAGFGGIEAAKSLRRAPVEVTVIDRQNHHCFQPLLYQVATAALSGRRGLADPPHSAQAEERDGAAGRSPRR